MWGGYDDWALAVLSRIESVNELRAEDAVYHKTYNSNFRTRKKIPAKHCNRKRGRPKNISLEAAMSKKQTYFSELWLWHS